MSRKRLVIKIKRPGAFSAKAKAAGMSIEEYAAAVLRAGSKASGLTKRQANFARNSRLWNHGVYFAVLFILVFGYVIVTGVRV